MEMQTDVAEEMKNPAVTGMDVRGKRIAVIGAARSGVAVAKLLTSNGAIVFVSDSAAPEKLQPQLAELRSAGIGFETGAHSDRLFGNDLLVLSPGVPSDSPIVREAAGRGLRIVSELEVASWFCPAPIVAVTGTNGKTTTTTLIGRMLHDGKKKHVVAGNIGTAFSSVLGELDGSSAAVVEVSSFQLDYIESFHPAIAIIMNITPDHLDRYDHDFEKYAASKCRVFENQTNEDVLVYNYDDAETRNRVNRPEAAHVRALPFGVERQFEEGAYVENGQLVTNIGGHRASIVAVNEISIRGIHNLYNSMAATLTAQLLGIGVPSIRATLRNFKGVEHRLEFVREYRGVKYVNDSKATNVESVWYALQAFEEPLVLMLGGRDKGNDYSKLSGLVERHVKAIVAIGESADKVSRSFEALKKVVRANSMEEAVQTARGLASPGDVVLLSPACASFDWFDNYEHRGKVFKQLVNLL